MDTELSILLEDVTDLINKYYNLHWYNGEELSSILKDLTAKLFFLEKHRTEYHQAHNKIQHDNKGAVSRGLIEANEQVPELYMLRRIINAGYKIVDAIRSNISFIKKEM